MAISSLNELITAAATEQLTTPARKDGTSVNSLRVNPIAETISLSAEDRRLTVDTTVQVEPSSTAVRVIDGGTPIVFVSGPTGPTGPSVISDTSIDATPVGLTTPAPAKFTRIGTDQEEFVLVNSVATRILFGGECTDLQLGSNQGFGQTTINNDTAVLGNLTVQETLTVVGEVALDSLSVVDGVYSGNLTVQETLTVSSYTTLNGPVGIARPASSSYELDVGGDIHADGSVIIDGDLTVNGATTSIETTNLIIKDKNIIIADGATTDAAADGAGITVKGASDKTIVWVDATDAWTLSEHLNIASGKEYRINGTSVLTSTTLGANVINSSLTKVGTLATGKWQADIITGTYGGTGVNNGANTITLGGNLSTANAFTTAGNFALTLTTTNITNVTLPTSGTLATLAGNESLTNKKLGSLTTNGIVTTSGGDGTLSVTATTGSGNVVLGTGPTISGTSTSITNVGTFALRDTSAAFDVTIAATSNPALTAGRTLTINMENAARSLILGGNIDIANNLTTSGNFALTLTTTNITNVTLPTSGTLATLAGNESLTNKKLGSLTTNGIVTTSGGDGTLSVTATTGSGNVVLATGPTISGTSTSITNVGTFALRDTSAAFDVTIAATSNPALTAGRTLTINVANAARSLNLAGNIDIANNLTTSGNFALTLTTTNTTNATLPAGTVTLAANNQTMFIGTTSVTINRASANLALTGITSIDGYAGSLAGGNSTTLLGSIPYQSDANVTTLLAPNTTANRRFLRMTGTGTNGAVPAWDSVTATDVGLGNVTNESKATMFTSPTFTGTVNMPTGTNSAAPVDFTSGPVLTNPLEGAIEFLNTGSGAFYATSNASQGRGVIGTYLITTGAGPTQATVTLNTNYPIFPAANDTLTVAAGTYRIAAALNVVISGTVAHVLSFDIKGAGNATITSMALSVFATNANSVSVQTPTLTLITGTGGQVAITATSAAAATNRIIQVSGIIRIGVAGTLIPSVAASAGTTGLSFGANNFMEFIPLGANNITAVGAWA